MPPHSSQRPERCSPPLLPYLPLCLSCLSLLQWLRNQTSAQLEELFEGIRAQNFRRMMAIASIASQLRGAFTSSNVLRSLEQLQTEDLERIASLPLFEERYQRLTNVTFLELLQQLYNFGLTQVCFEGVGVGVRQWRL